MIDFRVFFLVVLAAFVTLVVLQSPPRGDPFAADGFALRAALDRLPEEDITALKLRHAGAVPRYRIGLFGNSRSIQVGAKELKTGEGEFYNFSVPGASIRQSVSMVEWLAEIGKLPGVSIISFDNAALEFYGNPVHPPPPARWSAAARDVWHGLGDGNIGWRDTARMAWRHALTEWRALVALMNTERLHERWAANAANPGRPTFLADGSRPFSGAETTVELAPLDALPASVMPEYLAYDLSRLAAIHNPGGRIIV